MGQAKRCAQIIASGRRCRNKVTGKAKYCWTHAHSQQAKTPRPEFLIGHKSFDAILGPLAVVKLRSTDVGRGQPDVLLFSDLHNVPALMPCVKGSVVPIWSMDFWSAFDDLGHDVVAAVEGNLWHVGSLRSLESPEQAAAIADVYDVQAQASSSVLEKVDFTLRRCATKVKASCPLAHVSVVYAQIRELGAYWKGPQVVTWYWDYMLLEALGMMSSPWRSVPNEFRERSARWREVFLHVAKTIQVSAKTLLGQVADALVDLCTMNPEHVKTALFPPNHKTLLTKEVSRVPAQAQAKLVEDLAQYCSLQFHLSVFGHPGSDPRAEFVEYVNKFEQALEGFIEAKTDDLQVPATQGQESAIALWAAAAYMDAYLVLRTLGKHADSGLLVAFLGDAHVRALTYFFTEVRGTHSIDIHLMSDEGSRCLKPNGVVRLA